MEENLRPTRKQRRIRRVIEHRLRLDAQIQERKKLFNEMETLTFTNLTKMLDGTFSPDDFLMDRECDEDDYFRNTQLFQDQATRYLNFIYAADAEYHDPDGVSELLGHIENTTIVNSEPSHVDELVINYPDSAITISELNHHSVAEVEPLNLEFAAELRTLPVELQYAVTDNLSCAEKIIVCAHTGVAIKPCSPRKTINYRLDQRTGVINKCVGVNKDHGVDIYCSPSSAGFCEHRAIEYQPALLTYSIGRHRITETFLRPKPPPPLKLHQSKALRSMTVSGYNTIYSRSSRSVPSGCICQSVLFQKPQLIYSKSFVIGLAHAGYFPPRKRHLCVFGEAVKPSG